MMGGEGTLTCRQSWGCGSTKGYCTCGWGSGQAGLAGRQAARPSPPKALTLPRAGRWDCSNSRHSDPGPGRQHRLTWPLTGQAGSQLSAPCRGW